MTSRAAVSGDCRDAFRARLRLCHRCRRPGGVLSLPVRAVGPREGPDVQPTGAPTARAGTARSHLHQGRADPVHTSRPPAAGLHRGAGEAAGRRRPRPDAGDRRHRGGAEELGGSGIFERFDRAPLASASIGQVPAAELDGEEVVVKVRRPGAAETVSTDLEILESWPSRRAATPSSPGTNDLVSVTREFGRTLSNEPDYINEARNAERFATTFAQDPDVHIPAVRWEATTSLVLALDRNTGDRRRRGARRRGPRGPAGTAGRGRAGTLGAPGAYLARASVTGRGGRRP
ncbi:AarF/UbiB family protein [Georgenia muralis]|uniref:AarF/UbiB family protein n=1 Tax=Georgenia muralis TaxID=154117 RepID=UPI001FE3ADC8|nr:AarF/UbiB family protein [Georgenia muralis]